MDSFCQNIDEILDDTRFQLMTPAEIGCYVRMKCHCVRHGSMPSDIERLAIICCATNEQIVKNTLRQTAEFFVPIGGADREFVHLQIEKERRERRELSRKLSNNGKKGAEVRWGRKDCCEEGENA